jgi:WD40 repeat protein
MCAGAIMILDSATLEIIREERKAKQTIMDIKYGPPHSELLAVASSDGRVYVHGTKKYELHRVIETPTRNCAITKIDFSADGTTLRMCTNFDQLYYCTVQNGELITNPTLVRDHLWRDPSCPFSFASQGMHHLPNSFILFCCCSCSCA